MKFNSRSTFSIARATVCGIALAATLLSEQTLAAQVTSTPVTSWELTGEFSLNNNTNANGQAWSYGYQTLNNNTWVFSPLTQGGLVGSLQGWRNGALSHPGIYQNQAATPFNFGLVSLPSRHLVMVTGNACERPTVRFTPPAAATYRISGQFYGFDDNGSWPAKVFINQRSTLSNASAVIHQGQITPGGALQSSFTTKTVALTATDRLDFVVGCANGAQPFPHLWTGVHAVIERLVCPPGPPCD
jgi:hypothetical protein